MLHSSNLDVIFIQMLKLFCMDSRIILQVLISLGILLILIIFLTLSRRLIYKIGRRHNFHITRIFYARKVATLFFVILLLLVLSIVWGFDIDGLPIYFASFFGIVGIAFFASWSLLSNITASLIIFFMYPFRISDKIKIIDGENSIIGIVYDMTMFSIILKNEDGDLVSYPNNLLLQKPIQQIKR